MAAADKDWQKLSPFRHARLRTEMYFGSRDPHTQTVLLYENGKPVPREVTWVPALFTAFREILDNALDEVVAHKNGTAISVAYDPETLTVTVEDDGRGIPFDFDKTEKAHAATVLLSETMAGRNFGDDRGATRGLNGVGAAIVNFCSEWFRVEIWRGGKSFEQRFHEDEELVIEDPMIFPEDAKRHGTRISFKLSKKVFKDRRLPETFIAARLFEIALAYPKLKLKYNGKKVESKKGLAETLFPNRKPIEFEIAADGFKSRFWLIPSFMEDGSELVHGLVNGIPVFNGGTHVDAFKRQFYAGMLSALERESKRRKLQPNRSDLADGMLVYNITEMSAPSFDSQSKTRLINENVASIVKREMDDPEFFKGVVKRNPEWIANIYERCAARTQKKDDAEAQKLAKKNLRQKIEDLEDACGADRSKCILFLTEGKSAVSGLVEARDPNIHGGLPLRGKVLNVHGESAKSVLENEALAKIMKAIGLIPGQRPNRHTLRYGKVAICCDADEDGKNIAALLVNFFYAFWPELLDPERPPFLHVFETPLIIAAKGKQRKYWYADDYMKFDAEEYKGWEITRAKGLAALKREDWSHVLANPKVQPVVDDGKLTDTLVLLFDPKRADKRKEWIGM